MIQRLLYTSIASDPPGSGDISEILTISRGNNLRDDITGVLAIGDSWFLQVLEGPADRLDALLARLERDPRHGRIEVVMRRPIDARLFGGWSMAAIQTSPALAGTLEAALYNSRARPEVTVSTLFDIAHGPFARND